MAIEGISSAFQTFLDGAPKHAGASLDEVISAVLVGLPAAGNGVTQVLPAAIDAYEADQVAFSR